MGRRPLYVEGSMVKRLLSKKFSNLKNKKGLSTIVITVILIAVSMAAIALVWGVISNMLNNQIKNSESCFGNYDKVKLNGEYTCYTQIDSNQYLLRFSLGIGDIVIDKVIVGISSSSATKSYEITNAVQTISGLKMYPSGVAQIVLPEKNSGLTYEVSTAFTSKIDSIQIAPVINGVQCDVSDSILQIEDCELMGFE